MTTLPRLLAGNLRSIQVQKVGALISSNCQRTRDSDMLRHVFESVLRRCMSEGLVGGEGFAIDATVIKADANRTRGIAGTEAIGWSRGANCRSDGAAPAALGDGFGIASGRATTKSRA